MTVVETKVTDLVRDGWTGQILGVESETKGKRDYVSSQDGSIVDDERDAD